jgi:hypothetical protein
MQHVILRVRYYDCMNYAESSTISPQTLYFDAPLFVSENQLRGVLCADPQSGPGLQTLYKRRNAIVSLSAGVLPSCALIREFKLTQAI